ncbi:MAG TPA: carboxypeptidase-like regulatory domain-containing protein [Candidatus Aminicenantes bacterium]|nr:carboxypeptidase-like regulatory domain-containing protein [Candidatus Aminicenantes bacterium]
MSRQINGLAAVAALLLVLAAAPLHGQRMTAKITGSVSDEANQYLSGVRVTAINIRNNAVLSTETAKKKGAFRFLALDPGGYQLTFELDGFAPLTMSGILLNAEQSATLRVKLKKLPPAEAQGGS